MAPADQALGSSGCTDCHAKDAHLFSGPVVIDYFGDDGRPVTVSMARFMGLPESVEPVNRLFGLFLKTGTWILGAGVLLIMDTGFLRSVTQTLADMAPWLGPLSAFIAAAGYVYLVRTRVRHLWVSVGLHVSGAGTAITGILLWIRTPFDSRALFLISVIHGIFAVATAGLLGYFLLTKRPETGPDQSSRPGQTRTKQGRQTENQRDRHE